MPAYLQFLKSRWFIGVTALLVGALVILVIRFVSYDPHTTHYHANFSVYINGEQQKFVGSRYYEETAAMACTTAKIDNPKERAHMHDDIYDVIHVEDGLVTWGNFFQNLGWGLGDTYIQTDKDILSTNDQNKLTFIVNGKAVQSLYGLIINDLDRVLISYGTQNSDQIKSQYDSISSNAQQYNVKPDPIGCSGSRQPSFEDRVLQLF